ncbi:MAG: pyruvate dehydrogenase (acetyl-transferring) E1 component subunit alpha [Bradymonadaceae bacterium]
MNEQADETGDSEIVELDEELGTELRDELGDQQLQSMYRQMVLIRRFEQEAGRAYQRKKVRGFCHLYSGEEACAVGSLATLADHDYVITAYRDHGHALAAGLDPDEIMAELYGKQAGCSDGKGGSMHLFDIEKNFYGGWAIVGGQLPIATGVGFASDYRDEDAVCLCFFGEGAIHQGVFHESANLAENWGLPVVYIIEDNTYAMGTALERVSAVTDLRKKADGYDMAASGADGQDVFEVYRTVEEAVRRAREESKPTLVHLDTYRFQGHSMTDPATYRDQDELEEEQRRDPIQRFSNWLIDAGVCSQDELHAIDEEAGERVDEAVDFADSADFPDREALTEDVYVDWPWEIR